MLLHHRDGVWHDRGTWRKWLTPAQRGRRPAKPTASMIFTALATLRLRVGTSDGIPELPQPHTLQLRLLDLLNIAPRRGHRVWSADPTASHVRITGLEWQPYSTPPDSTPPDSRQAE